MIRTVDIIDEVIEFCITDRFKARRQEQYRHGEERDSKSTRQRTIRQMIIDYDHLIDIINTKIQ